MPVKHSKTNAIAAWTQTDLDAAIAAGQFPPGTTLSQITLSTDWNSDHTFTGGTTGDYLMVGSGGAIVSGAGGGGSPASPTNSVQFNNAGSFGGSANLTYVSDQLLGTSVLSSTVPIYSFSGDTGTGIGRSASGAMVFTSASTATWVFANGSSNTTKNLTISNNAAFLVSGYARVGLTTTPPNTTSGDLTSIRHFLHASTALVTETLTPVLQIAGIDSNASSIAAYRYSANNVQSRVVLSKSRGATVGTHSIVSSGDGLGSIDATGSDGTAFQQAAQLVAEVDGAPALGIVPGRWRFLTANASGVATEAVRIDSSQTTTFANSIVAPNLNDSYFGTGLDGNVTISSGVTILTRDMYYNNLTINGTGQIAPNGWRIFVGGVLDLSSAPAGAISFVLGPGGNASGSTGGAAPATVTGSSVGTYGFGTNGATGVTGVGVAGGAGGTGLATNGGRGGNTGAGGSGASGAGAVSANGLVSSNTTPIYKVVEFLTRGPTLLVGGGGSSRGGGSGAGDGTNNGGGGGGAGNGGPAMHIAARTINRGASTAVAAITVKGSDGGNGGTPTTGNCGGGGAGGPGAGGWLYLVYQILTGSTATNMLDASGGKGGNGGDGIGTGTGGNGAQGGDNGRITVINNQTRTATEIVPTGGNPSGTVASGITGGVGAAGLIARMSL